MRFDQAEIVKKLEEFSIGNIQFIKFIDEKNQERMNVKICVHDYNLTKYQALELADRLLNLFEIGKSKNV